jgi:energy-coupling factor transporter ATP-binding protein EcfA2
MISLPSLRALHIDGYGLYPGTDAQPGLHVDFEPGLTLTLGANGLGKSTLVAILYRLLTGPSEIPKLSEDGTLGSPRLEVRDLSRVERATFADRVVDRAREATATLSFWLGGAQLSVRRRLDTLALVDWSLDGTALETTEAAYRAVVLQRAGMAAFSDWILALRHLVFYFEDRRALVWDPSAQRQLLRFLFLEPEQALSWRQQEREVLSLDSQVRNLLWQYNREQALVAKARRAASKSSVAELRERLASLSAKQVEEQRDLAELQQGLPEVAAERQDARVAALNAEDQHESAVWGVERLQLEVIEAAFPDAGATARYVLGQVLAETSCLVCTQVVPDFRAQVEERIRSSRCPLCSSRVEQAGADSATTAAALAEAVGRVAAATTQRDAAAKRRDDADRIYTDLLDRISSLNTSVSRRAADIAEIVRRLPAEQDARLHQSQLTALGSRVEDGRRELEGLRASFDAFVREVNTVIAERKDAIKQTFDAYAEAFLVETASLTWQPRKERVGQGGGTVEFPAFALDMSASSFASPVRRNGPDSVSESQREFIDLSFRMALMDVATDGGATLVVDAPESSIDAVFSGRAANVLIRFAARDENRLLVTSNLVDGALIPRLLGLAGITTANDPRVVDLLELASPTAATRQYAADYEEAKARIFGLAGQP